VKRLEKEMYAASAGQDYEKAARLRDDLGALNRRWRSRRWCSATAPTPT
jgi:excinuclease UvrABC nuclease subunit